MSYKKQKHINKDFNLIRSVIIPENSFILDNKDYNVKCVAQIWIKKEIEIEPSYDSWNNNISKLDLDIFFKYYKDNGCMNSNELFHNNNLRFYRNIPNMHPNFKTCYFVPTCWTNTEAFVENAYNKSDWFMKYVGGTIHDKADKTKGAWIGFFNCTNDVRKVMEKVDWSFLHITKTTQPTISAEDIVYAYNKYK